MIRFSISARSYDPAGFGSGAWGSLGSACWRGSVSSRVTKKPAIKSSGSKSISSNFSLKAAGSVSQVFDWDEWQDGFDIYWRGDQNESVRQEFRTFKRQVLVALYMKPPDNAVVLCVDEKTGIQALDRTQPTLPLRATKARSWTNEYVRHSI